ncbi:MULTISPECIES: DUF4179 domain-containing protein [unclassified Paenibacillus]|uniref:DUF4179 domain-containing protein n=1 Tax=unclassified Paenibacillus TaxID=185978 RepID=UPI000CFC6C77|nr:MULTISPECIES: DUF4179 domain-containing protein [unclassified Paenibacillus]PRA05700.1 hypothetical protein CQ043_17035 [Paenibacillus sp. MYb63]PRA49950.1 hypothetical protein CQ061_05795 [Paenibacillus sp. MYb67]QZN75645.1 DUF4179 domain-containing protein [Paenibacillus sp. DR312]
MTTNPEEKALLADAYQVKREKQHWNPADTTAAIQRGLAKGRTKRSGRTVRFKCITAVLVTILAAGWFLIGPFGNYGQQLATYTEPVTDWGVLEPFRDLLTSDMDRATITSTLNNGYVQLVDRTVTSGIYQFTVNAVMADENRITVLYTARTDASQKMYSIVNTKMTDARTGYVLDNGNIGGGHFSNDKHTIYGRNTIERNRNKPLPEQVNLQFQLSSVVPDVVENSENGEKERKYQFSKKMNLSFALDPKFSIPKTEIINVNRTFTVGGYEVMLSEVELSPLVTRVRLVYEPDQEIDYKTKLLISEVVQPIEIVTTSKGGKQTKLSMVGGSGTEDGMMYSFSSNLLDHPESMILKLSGKPGKVYDDLQEAKKDELDIKIK